MQNKKNLKTELISNQSGNAIWFVLMAIILLGVLTVSITNGGRSSDQKGDFERLSVKVSKLLRYAKGISSAIDKMRMVNGCSEVDINFFDPDVTELAGYERSPDTDDECKVFNAKGAGLSWQAPPSGINDGSGWIFNGTTAICDLESDRTEVLILLKDMNKKACEMINRQLYSDSVEANTGSGEDNSPFVSPDLEGSGSYELCSAVTSGKSTGCVLKGDGEYVFYHVLIPR